MVYDGILEGYYVVLKACTEEDAEFTRKIRQDPDVVKFIPEIDNTIEEQKEWICRQRKKEGDYFFVVWDKDGHRIGTISIYNVHGKRAESGRLIIKGKIPFQCIEAQLLIFRFAFGILGLECIDGFIFANNERAIRFNKQFGGKHYPPEVDKGGRTIIRIENWRDDFEENDRRLSSVLYRKNNQRIG